MNRVGARELKTRLGRYLELVRDGVTIIVTQRGRPVAELRPIGPKSQDLQTRLADMEAHGLITIGGGGPYAEFEPVRLRDGAALSDAVLEDREDRV